MYAWSLQGGRGPPSLPWRCFPVPTTPSPGESAQGDAFQQLLSWALRLGGQEGGPPRLGFSLLCFVLSWFRATLSCKPKDEISGIPLCMVERKMLTGPSHCPSVTGLLSLTGPRQWPGSAPYVGWGTHHECAFCISVLYHRRLPGNGKTELIQWDLH